MSRLSITIFYDPRAKDSPALMERMANLGPSLGIGVTYVDITQDRELMKNYKTVAPVGTIAGSIVFTGALDEMMVRSRVKNIMRRKS